MDGETNCKRNALDSLCHPIALHSTGGGKKEGVRCVNLGTCGGVAAQYLILTFVRSLAGDGGHSTSEEQSHFETKCLKAVFPHYLAG